MVSELVSVLGSELAYRLEFAKAFELESLSEFLSVSPSVSVLVCGLEFVSASELASVKVFG